MKNKLLSLLIAPAMILGAIVGVGANPTPAQAAVTEGEIAAAVNTILADTNAARAVQGLPPLNLNPQLSAVSQAWTEQMALEDHMYHNPSFGTQIPSGWTYASENVAYGYTINSVVNGWINSPGHYANIMGAGTDIGIGYATTDTGRTYFTQNFAHYPSSTTPPSRLNGVTVSPTGNGQATVNFYAPTITGNTPVTHYEYLATNNTNPGNNSSGTFTAPGAQVINGLQGGSTYQIQVRAVNAKGAGYWSNPVTVEVQGVPTVGINNLDGDSYSATLEWGTSANGSTVTGHTITLSNHPTIQLAGDVTSYHFENLIPGNSYLGTITATNGMGTSETINFLISTPAVEPEVPQSLTAYIDNKTEIVVNWTEPEFDGGANITNYAITFNNGEGHSITDTVPVSQTSYRLNNAVRGTNYTFTVHATNSVGNSPTVSDTIHVPFTAPDPAVALQAEIIDEQTIEANWNRGADTGGTANVSYIVELVEVNSGNTVSTETTTATTIVFDNTVVNASTDYMIRVTVDNSHFESPAVYSNIVEVPAEPTPPSFVTELSTSNITSNSVRVTWNEPTDNGGAAITGYEIFVHDADENEVETVTVNSNTFSYTINGLDRYTDYAITVTAENNKGLGVPAATLTQTLAEKPSEPTVFNSTYIFSSSSHDALAPVVLVLQPTDNGGDDNLTYLTEILYENEVVASTTTSTSGILTTVEFDEPLTGITLGEDVQVRITATNSAGNSEPTVSTFTTPTAASAPEVDTTFVDETEYTVTWEEPTNTGTPFNIQSYYVEIFDADTDEIITNGYYDATEREALFIAGIDIPRNVTVYATVTALSHPTSTLLGESGQSTTSTHIPAYVPTTPIDVNVNPIDDEVDVHWTQESDGGAEISHWTVKLVNADTDAVFAEIDTDMDSVIFTNVPGGIQFYVTVTATNSVGTSSPAVTGADYVTNPSVPQPAENVTLSNLPNQEIEVNITAGHSGGSPIIAHTYTLFNETLGEVTETITTNDTSVVFGNLQPGHVYTATVTTYNAIGSSTGITSDTLKVPAVAPNIPTVEVEETMINQALITMTNNGDGGADITHYEITVNGATYTPPADQNGNLHNFLITGLLSLTDYTVTVKAINEAGTSVPASATFKTSYATPNPVTELQYVELLEGREILITWEAPEVDATVEPHLTYNVAVKTSEGETVTSTQTAITTATAHVGYGFNGTIEVEAVVLDKTSTPATTPVETSAAAPEMVTTLNSEVTDEQNYTVNFTWEEPTNNGAEITHYDVKVMNNDHITLFTTTVENPSFTTSELQAGKQYRIQVQAVNSAGTAQAVDIPFEAPTTAPSAPQNVTVTEGLTKSSMNVVWEEPTNNGGTTLNYTVTINSTVLDEPLVHTTNNLNYVISELEYNTLYTVTVTAVNALGESTSEEVNYTTPIVTPTAVNNLEATSNLNNTAITVNWENPTNNGGENPEYNVTVSDSTNTVVTEVTTNELTATLEYEFLPNTTYTVTVTPENSAGEGPERTHTVTTNIVAPQATTPTLTLTDERTLTVAFPPTSETGGVEANEIVYTYTVTDTTTDTVIIDNETGTPNMNYNIMVEPGHTYNVTVTVSNTAGTVEATETLRIPAVAPTIPTNVNISVNEINNTTTLTIDAPAYDGGAEIINYVYQIVDNTNTVVIEGETETGTVTIPGEELTPNSNYNVNVTAVNADELESPTYETSFVTNIIAPNKVSNLTLEADGSDTVNVTFTTPDENSLGGDIESNLQYRVALYDADGLVEATEKTTVEADTTVNHTFTGLDYATNYTVRVTVYNSVTSATVESDTVKTDGIAPTTPEEVTVATVNKTTAKLSWVEPENFGGVDKLTYRITYSNETGDITGVVTTEDTTVNVDVEELDNVYSFTVVAYNEFGESSPVDADRMFKSAPSEPVNALPGDVIEESKDSYELFEATQDGNKTITVKITAPEGDWYAGVAYSEPVHLGWEFVNNGELTYDISSMPVGEHTLAVYDTNGVIVGTADFTITAPPVPVDPDTNEPADTEGVTPTGEDDASQGELEVTGANNNVFLMTAILLLMAGGTLLLVSRRKVTVK